MNISRLTRKSPPRPGLQNDPSHVKEAPKQSEDSFERSEKGSISVGAGILAAVSLFGMAACTPPPSQQQPPEVVVDESPEESVTVSLAKEDDGKPMTELEIRQRELELREREVAVRERELGVLQRREKGEARLRTLQEQREAREKAERIGKGIGDTISILDAIGGALKDGANEVLR
jgi:TolA-binding protein